VAAAMFARWCQENFFRYMRQHYNLDRLAEYGVEPVPDTTRRYLCEELTSTETVFPGTDLRLIYEIAGSC